MKFANYGILFGALFLGLMIMDHIRSEAVSKMTALSVQYNNAVDNSVEAAMAEAVELDTGHFVFVNKEEVMERFFTALYVNFDSMENPGKKKLLEACVPVGVFVDRDSMTITYKNQEGRKWDTIPFIQEYGDYRIFFTLSDYIIIEEKSGQFRLEGDYHDVKRELLRKEAVPEEARLLPFEKAILMEVLGDLVFEEERRRVIIDTLEVNLTKAVKEHNHYAKKMGVEYEFQFPVIEREEWYQTMDDMSFFVLFQGYPYGGFGTKCFSKVAFGGAQLKKTRFADKS